MQMLDFTAKLVEQLPLPVGSNVVTESRVAAINFDSSALVDFDFTFYTTPASAEAALRAITPIVINGGTATHQAVNQLRSSVLLDSAGWRGGAVPTAVVFVTDGAASDAKKTDTAIANFDAAFGFTISRFAIGVGDYNATQLLGLAHGVVDHVSTFNAFAGLVDDSFVASFITKIFC
jgi:uncharacterized protein YegL